MSTQAFSPQANTVGIFVDTTAPTAVQVNSGVGVGSQVRIINSANVTVFLGWGASATDAANNAVVLANATAIVLASATKCVPIIAGTVEVLTFPPLQFFTGITASGNGAVFLTPGDGM